MFLAECGIARVDTLEGLIEGFPLLARVPAPARGARPPAVAVVTTTAGGATMVVDPLSMRGIAVAPPTPQTLARIKEATGVDVAPARLIDLTLAGAQYKVMKGALDVLTTAPEYDLVVVVVGSSARFYPDLAVKPIIDSAAARSRSRRSWCPRRPMRWRVWPPRACRTFTRRRLAPMRSPPRCGVTRRGRPKCGHASRPAQAGCWTSSRPMACSTASACRMRRRSRSMQRSPRRPPCPSPIRSWSRRCRPRSRTSPMSAAWC